MVSTQRNTEEIFWKGFPFAYSTKEDMSISKGIDIQAERLSADLVLTMYPRTTWYNLLQLVSLILCQRWRLREMNLA